MSYTTWSGEAKAAIVAAAVAGAVGICTAFVAPLMMDHVQATRAAEQAAQDDREASYGPFLDSAHQYFLALSSLGVIVEGEPVSVEGVEMDDDFVPPSVQLADDARTRESLALAREAWRDFDAERARTARDLTPGSLPAFNQLVSNLPAVDSLVQLRDSDDVFSAEASVEVSTLDAQNFRDAYYAFVDRFRQEARGDQALWTP